MTNFDNLDTLGEVAVNMAAVAARTYYRANGLTYDSMDHFCSVIKTEVVAHLEKALADAKDALDANMPQIAEATFKAEMMLAGIATAKACSKPAEAK